MRRLEKTIREIGWTHAVPRLDVGEPVSRAFDAMSREVHDCVLVTQNGQLAGIFTSRDFLNRVAAVRADPAALVLGDVMTSAPRTLRPRDPVVFAINWMAVEGFRNVPILDDAGAVWLADPGRPLLERFLAGVDATGWRCETFLGVPDTVTICRLRRAVPQD